jgi:hypothetical protein
MSLEMRPSLTGGCLCGAVRYRVEGPLRDVVICHCSQCRRYHGHAVAFTSVPADRLAFTEDRGLGWYRSSDAAERGFCRICGSSLFWRRLGGDEIAVTAGSLDGETGLVCRAHVFTAFKGDYYEIPDDGTPRHAEWPGNWPGSQP